MSLFTAPLWLQIALVAEALALGWLVARFGGRGLLWGLLAALGFWFLLAFAGSFLVSRLEGGAPSGPGEILQGAALATARLAQVSWPLILAGAAAGGVCRFVLRRRRAQASVST